MDLSASGPASALTCILNVLSLRSLGEFSKGDPFAKEKLNGPFVQFRDVSVLLSGRRCAGVYFGLDSESGITNPSTHPPNGAVGFSFPRAPVAKRQTRGSAKPVFAGSIPARRSIQTNRQRIHISKADTPSRRGLPLDAYAVALALGLALLIRLNLLPPIKW